MYANVWVSYLGTMTIWHDTIFIIIVIICIVLDCFLYGHDHVWNKVCIIIIIIIIIIITI